jgi:hypothetical protein
MPTTRNTDRGPTNPNPNVRRSTFQHENHSFDGARLLVLYLVPVDAIETRFISYSLPAIT